MSFSCQRIICYLVDLAISILVANWLYKTLVVLKHQRFENSRSDKMELRGSKRQQLDLHDDEKGEGLDKFEDEGKRKGIGYVPLLFVTPPQKELNRLTDMDKETRSLNHFVCIPKIG